MAYDIPQELKYKEIFAYGMTFRQFIYVTFSGVASVLILSNKEIPQEIGALAGITLMGMAVLLGFLDFDRKILEFFSYLLAPKNIIKLDRKSSEYLGIRYLKDSAIVLRDGTIIGVVGIDAINFSILSKEQKEAVIYNFMSFLNSLRFRAHVIMRTVTLDMDQYLNRTGLNSPMRGEFSADAYSLREFLAGYVRDNSVTDRIFCITVPLKNTYGRGKEHLAYRELEERMTVMQEWLAKSMLNARRLDNAGILAFLGLFLRDDIRLHPESTSPFTLKGGVQ
jgi:hypothetical protein